MGVLEDLFEKVADAAHKVKEATGRLDDNAERLAGGLNDKLGLGSPDLEELCKDVQWDDVCYVCFKDEAIEVARTSGEVGPEELTYAQYVSLLTGKFPKVHNCGLNCDVYLNPQNVVSVESGFWYTVKFVGGVELGMLSGEDYEKNCVFTNGGKSPQNIIRNGGAVIGDQVSPDIDITEYETAVQEQTADIPDFNESQGPESGM